MVSRLNKHDLSNVSKSNIIPNLNAQNSLYFEVCHH
jgi:hypothetical protein